MRVAMIASRDFDTVALDDFIYKLQGKYPDVTIVTGNGQGGEKTIKATAEGLGMRVEQPALRDDWFGKQALDCQINDVLIGADVIVLVGQPTASRTKVAGDWYKRCIAHLKPADPLWRPLHTLAPPAPKTTTAAAARKKTKKDAVANLDNAAVAA